jgi:hypothetical protein
MLLCYVVHCQWGRSSARVGGLYRLCVHVTLQTHVALHDELPQMEVISQLSAYCRRDSQQVQSHYVFAVRLTNALSVEVGTTAPEHCWWEMQLTCGIER